MFGGRSSLIIHEQYLRSSVIKHVVAGDCCYRVYMYTFHLNAECLWLLSWHKHQLLLSGNFIHVFHVLVLCRLSCSRIPYLVVSPRAVLREPIGDGHGEAEQAQADTVHLWSDGNIRKESPIPANGSAVALKVFDNVEDLLAFCLPHHPPNVQQSGNMLFPVEGRMDGGRWEDEC